MRHMLFYLASLSALAHAPIALGWERFLSVRNDHMSAPESLVVDGEGNVHLQTLRPVIPGALAFSAATYTVDSQGGDPWPPDAYNGLILRSCGLLVRDGLRIDCFLEAGWNGPETVFVLRSGGTPPQVLRLAYADYGTIHDAVIDAVGRLVVASSIDERQFSLHRFDGSGSPQMLAAMWSPCAFSALELAAPPDGYGEPVRGYVRCDLRVGGAWESAWFFKFDPVGGHVQVGAGIPIYMGDLQQVDLGVSGSSFAIVDNGWSSQILEIGPYATYPVQIALLPASQRVTHLLRAGSTDTVRVITRLGTGMGAYANGLHLRVSAFGLVQYLAPPGWLDTIPQARLALADDDSLAAAGINGNGTALVYRFDPSGLPWLAGTVSDVFASNPNPQVVSTASGALIFAVNVAVGGPGNTPGVLVQQLP